MAERAADGAATQTVQTSAASVLGDLPGPLWEGLAAALRRLADAVPQERLPRRLLPFVRIRAAHLDRPEVRQAVCACMPVDARLRADLLESLPDDLVAAAAESDVAQLEQRFGAPVATAALVGHGRWDALAILSDRVAADLLADRAAEGGDANGAEEHDEPTTSAALARLSAQLEDAERRAEAAGARARDAQRRAERAADRVAELEETVAGLRAQLASEERDHRKRLARLQRQAREGRDANRAADARLARVGEQLEQLLDELKSGDPPATTGTEVPGGAGWPDGADRSVGGEGADIDVGEDGRTRRRHAVARVPRGVPAAAPGRPCVLPPGVAPRSEAAVLALTQVDGLELILDGYNVTMDLRGRPSASLDDQRRWLVRTVAGLAATAPIRPTIVFDGTDVAAPAPTARGVRTVFTSDDEQADDRIRAFVRGLDDQVPVLVVTSDRQVRDDVLALGGDVAASGLFLKAVGASA